MEGWLLLLPWADIYLNWVESSLLESLFGYPYKSILCSLRHTEASAWTGSDDTEPVGSSRASGGAPKIQVRHLKASQKDEYLCLAL